jgi:Domain of unknown function (DUF4384)
MRNTILAGLALAALAAVPAAAEPAPAGPAPALLLEAPPAASLATLAADAQQGGVQVWMDGYRDVYRPGERMSVRVRAQRDGYLAVFHIDTNGDVDIIYPQYQEDDGWIEGGRTLRLGSRGGWDHLRVNGGYGMGYVMAVMLDEPLELWRVRDFYQPRNAGWDPDRTIWGDPFYAMDEIVRTVVPEGWEGYESVDHTTYHVGSQRYRYPRYACYDGYGDWYHHRGVYWDDCDRVRIVLVNYPYYYDAWRWRHPRRVYYERYYYPRVVARHRPLHGYKERTSSYAPPTRATAQRRPSPDRSRDGSSQGSAAPNRDRRPGTYADRPAPAGDRSRTGSRAGVSRPETRSAPGSVRGGSGGSRPSSAPRSGPSSRPARGPSSPQVQDDEPRQQDRPVQPSRERPTFQRRPSEPTRSATPRRETPQRETPPSRSATPRRESPPQRQAEPRRESPPPQRSAQPQRSSPPQRSAQPQSRPSGNRGSSDGGSRSSSPPSRRN